MGLTSSEVGDLAIAICRYNGVLAGSRSERIAEGRFWPVREAIEALREEDRGFFFWLISLAVHDLDEICANRSLVTEERP